MDVQTTCKIGEMGYVRRRTCSMTHFVNCTQRVVCTKLLAHSGYLKKDEAKVYKCQNMCNVINGSKEVSRTQLFRYYNI